MAPVPGGTSRKRRGVAHYRDPAAVGVNPHLPQDGCAIGDEAEEVAALAAARIAAGIDRIAQVKVRPGRGEEGRGDGLRADAADGDVEHVVRVDAIEVVVVLADGAPPVNGQVIDVGDVGETADGR